MERMTVFHHASNDEGYIAAVILASECHAFYGLGFVASVDLVEEPDESQFYTLAKENDELRSKLAALADNSGNHPELDALHAEIADLKQRLSDAINVADSEAPLKSDAPPADTDGAPAPAPDDKKKDKGSK